MLRAARRRAPRLTSRTLPYLVLLVALLLTALITASFAASARANDQLRFEREVQQTQSSIVTRLDAYAAALRGVAGLFAASEDISRTEFRAYVERLGLRERYPGMQGVGYSLRVRPGGEAAVIAMARAQGIPEFRIWPADPRDELHTILYLEPLDRRNRAALGYDMFSEPARRAAMERARDTGQPAATGRVTLVQEIDENKQAGFLIYVPVYRGSLVPETEAERREHLLGFAYSPFRVNDLMLGIFSERTDPLVSFEIYDGAVLDAEHLLYRSDGGAQPDSSLVATTDLAVAGRTWTVRYAARPTFTRAQRSGLVPFVGLAGVLISGVLFALVQSQVRARNQAEAAVRVRDEFFSVASHELKTPITALLGNSQLVLRRLARTGTFDDRDRRSLEVIAEQAHRLNRLVGALLDHSRIQAGRLTIERAPVDLAEVLRRAADEIRPTLAAHTLNLELPPAPLVVLGDDVRLTQVIQNLVGNAVKYSPAGGPVDVRLAQDGDAAEISVVDRGLGIPATALPHLFQQFYRAPNVDAHSIAGLGIGLYVIHQIVTQHGGSVAAASVEGHGSTFTVRLPLAPGEREAAEAQGYPTAPSSWPQ
jgi:signal transduction histidine kinase